MRNLKIASLTVALMTLGSLASAGSYHHHRLRGPAQVTFAGTSADPDGDGFPGSIISGTFAARGGMTLSGLVDVTFSGFDTARCPGLVDNAMTAFPLVIADKRADQIWTVLTSGYLCFDPGTGAVPTVSADLFVVGGTGRYAGASGTASLGGGGVALASDFSTAPARIGFGALAGEFEVDLD